jgi:hypothetical protein
MTLTAIVTTQLCHCTTCYLCLHDLLPCANAHPWRVSTAVYANSRLVNLFQRSLTFLLTPSQCRLPESGDGPCERCVKEGNSCENRPVDSSSASNNHAHNYPDEDHSTSPFSHMLSVLPRSSALRHQAPMACMNCHVLKLKVGKPFPNVSHSLAYTITVPSVRRWFPL